MYRLPGQDGQDQRFKASVKQLAVDIIHGAMIYPLAIYQQDEKSGRLPLLVTKTLHQGENFFAQGKKVGVVAQVRQLRG